MYFKGAICYFVYLIFKKCNMLKVRERREKTRLRVARWRAKRKLQACLNQAQVGNGRGIFQYLNSKIGFLSPARV